MLILHTLTLYIGYAPIMKPAQVPPVPPPATPPARHNLLWSKHLRQALQAFRLQCLNYLCMYLFPQIHRQTLHPLCPSCKMPRRISALKAPSAPPSEPRRSGRTSHVPGFHWHVIVTTIANIVYRDIAARRRHVGGLPTFSNASFW